MNFHQHEQRQAATRQFLESLNELEHCAHTTEEPDLPAPPSSAAVQSGPSPQRSSPDLAAWEDAARDIEQFMQSR